MAATRRTGTRTAAAIDAVLATTQAARRDEGEGAPTHLTEAIDEAAVAAFVRASARLSRAAPWRLVPADEALSLSIGELGIHGMAVTVVGQSGSAHGLVIVEDLASFRDLLEAADAEVRPAERPPHLAVLAGAADADAAPWPVAVDEDGVPRPMTADELFVAEATALAVADLVASTPDLPRAWSGGGAVTRTLTVPTHQGPLAVTLIAPAGAAIERGASPDGVVAELGRLEETAEELDPAQVGALSAGLVAELRASPEGRSLPDGPSWAEVVMALGVRHFDATIASLGPEELTEILHELLPRSALAPAGEAPAIVDELRALYAFLGREHGLEQAADCLEVLGADAVERLAAALGDDARRAR